MKKIWSRTLRPGEKWSGNIGRGKYIHFKALGDDANVSMLMYNMLDTSERYNMPDTLKAQFISSLTKGNVLMSDNGRVLASIVEDSLGWHDTISGYTTRLLTDEKYGNLISPHSGVERLLRRLKINDQPLSKAEWLSRRVMATISKWNLSATI